MNDIKEALGFRDFCQKLEKAITVLMETNKMRASKRVKILERKMAVFVASRNVGYGGPALENMVFFLIPKGTAFEDGWKIKSEDNVFPEFDVLTLVPEKTDWDPSFTLAWVVEEVFEHRFPIKVPQEFHYGWEEIELETETVTFYRIRA